MPLQPAPFLRRLAARLIDLAFALVLTFVIALPVAVVYALTAGLFGDRLWLTLLVAFCYFLAYVGLEVYLLVRRDGQTLGKGLMGLRVVPADAESQLRAPLVIGQAALRMLLIFLRTHAPHPVAAGRPHDGAREGRLVQAILTRGPGKPDSALFGILIRRSWRSG